MTIKDKMYWRKGDAVVEVIRTGHYPTTVIVKLPSGVETEVDMIELEEWHG